MAGLPVVQSAGQRLPCREGAIPMGMWDSTQADESRGWPTATEIDWTAAERAALAKLTAATGPVLVMDVAVDTDCGVCGPAARCQHYAVITADPDDYRPTEAIFFYGPDAVGG